MLYNFSLSLNLKLQLLSGHFEFLMPVDDQVQSRGAKLEEVIEPDHHEEQRLLLCHGSREEYTGRILGTAMPDFNYKWQI